MGTFYVNAVLYGLEGHDPEIVTRCSGEKSRKKKLGPTEMAILLAIAARQPNPGSFHGDLDPVCYCNSQKLADLTHTSRTTVDELRNGLVKLGVIKYAQSEKRVDANGDHANLKYVYRINLDYLRKLAPDLAAWRRILKIDVGSKLPVDVQNALRALSESSQCPVHNAKGGVRDAAGGVRNAAGGVRNADESVRNADTNINRSPQEEHNQQNTSGAVLLTDVDKGYLDRVVGEIARRCNVDKINVGRGPLRQAIKDKHPDDVYHIVENLDIPPGIKNPVAFLITKIRELPSKGQRQPASGKPAVRKMELNDVLKESNDTVREIVRQMVEKTKCRDVGFYEKKLIPLANSAYKRGLQSELVEIIYQASGPKSDSEEDRKAAAEALFRAGETGLGYQRSGNSQ